jgi:hypothetical protein
MFASGSVTGFTACLQARYLKTANFVVDGFTEIFKDILMTYRTFFRTHIKCIGKKYRLGIRTCVLDTGIHDTY